MPRRLATAALGTLAVLVLAAGALVAARALGHVPAVTGAIVAALLLAALTRPLAVWLGRRLPASLASLLTVLVTTSVVVGVLALVVNRALAQAEDLRQATGEAFDELEQSLLESPLPLSSEGVTSLEGRVTDGLAVVLPSPSAAVGTAAEAAGAVVLAIFLWFFLLRDGPRMWRWALGWVPARRRDLVGRSGDSAWSALTSYVRGTVVVATGDAVGIGVSLLALGVPMAASLTSLVFLGAFVPILGATLSGGLAAVVALVTRGPVVALLVVAAVLVVQQVEGNLLQPLVLGRAMALHPAGIVLAVAVGASVAGVLGAVVAVPATAVVLRVAELLRSDVAGDGPSDGGHGEHAPGPPDDATHGDPDDSRAAETAR